VQIKRSFLFFLLTSVVVFLLFLAGSIAYVLFHESDLAAQDRLEKALLLTRSNVQHSVDAFISGVESDFAYCSERNMAAGTAESLCESGTMIDMVKRKLETLVSESQFSLSVFEVKNDRNGLSVAENPVALYTFPGLEPEISPASISSETVEQIIDAGYMYVDTLPTVVSPDNEEQKVNYAYYYPRLNWVIWATADAGGHSLYLPDANREETTTGGQKILQIALSAAFFFLLTISIIGYFTSLRLAKIVQMQDTEKTPLPSEDNRVVDPDESDMPLESDTQKSLDIDWLLATSQDGFFLLLAVVGGEIVIDKIGSGTAKILGYEKEELNGKPFTTICSTAFNVDLLASTITGEALLIKKSEENLPVHYLSG